MDAANFFADLQDTNQVPNPADPLHAFLQVLPSPGPSAELDQASELYGWLVGSWAMDVIDYDDKGSRYTSKGEWHFAWVLEGRAIQDVFIVPVQTSRQGIGKENNRYGTSLRVYDPAMNAWHITWINPVRVVKSELIGRRKGNDIVQEGKTEDGSLMRWSFVEIKRDSFRWLGEISTDNGKTWQLQAEFFGRRMKTQ